jgi:hypothetical protein
MLAKHVKVINESTEDDFQKKYEKAISELGDRAKKVTFDTVSVVYGAENDNVEMYYTAYIEYD